MNFIYINNTLKHTQKTRKKLLSCFTVIFYNSKIVFFQSVPTSVISFNQRGNTVGRVLFSLFRWGNWRTERFGAFSQVTQLPGDADETSHPCTFLFLSPPIPILCSKSQDPAKPDANISTTFFFDPEAAALTVGFASDSQPQEENSNS